MRLLLLWVGLVLGNVASTMLLDITSAQVIERSFFQGMALLAAALIGAK